MSNKPTRRSTKSRLSSSLSLISNSGQSGKDRVVKTRKESSVSPSDIPRYKWREIIDDAEVYSVANYIREEIIRNAMDAIYDRYLEKTSYVFVVDCSYRAWLQLFDVSAINYRSFIFQYIVDRNNNQPRSHRIFIHFIFPFEYFLHRYLSSCI